MIHIIRCYCSEVRFRDSARNMRDCRTDKRDLESDRITIHESRSRRGNGDVGFSRYRGYQSEGCQSAPLHVEESNILSPTMSASGETLLSAIEYWSKECANLISPSISSVDGEP